MGIFNYSRTLGVAVMAWGMISFGHASDLAAETLLFPSHADRVKKSAEPFGVFAFRLYGGELWEKWIGVQRALADDMVQLALCNGEIGNAAYRPPRFDFSQSWTMRKPARDAPASARSTAPSISQSTQ